MATKGLAPAKPPKPPKVAKVPFTKPNALGVLPLKKPVLPKTPAATTVAPPPPPTTTTVAFKPDANWWNAQFQADPRWVAQNPAFTAAEEGTASKYGYRINKINNQTAYKSSTGVSGITQVVDANGVPVLDANGFMQYKDATGKLYAPGDLVLDIVKIKPGEEGYLQGEIGATTAQSAVQQQGLAEQAAQAGARRSGMRESVRSMEAGALSRALNNVFGSATGAFADIGEQRRNLASEIYKTLLERAGSTPGTTVETPAAPAAAPAAETTAQTGIAPGQALTPSAFDSQLGGIANMGKNADKKTMIRLYRNLAKSYALTPAQIKRLTKILKNEYGASL